MATTFDRLRTIVAGLLGIDEADIAVYSEFGRDLNADSLDVVEIVLAVEQEFDIEVTDEDVENVRTMADAVQVIDALRG